MLVENNEAGISARQTRQRSEQDLAVSQLGYLASPAHQAATAQVSQLGYLASPAHQAATAQVSQLGYLASPAHQAATAQVHNFKHANLKTIK